MRYRTIATLAAIAALGIACGSGGNDATDTSGSGGGDTKTTDAKTAKVGQPVRDGLFEFVVSKPQCGKASVGASVIAEKAQGMFCLVPITVKNIGKKPQAFAGDNQKVTDTKGAEYTNDSAAEVAAASGGSPTLYTDINPGNSIKGNLIFDVPKGTKLKAIELHDSLFSGGVTVALT